MTGWEAFGNGGLCESRGRFWISSQDGRITLSEEVEVDVCCEVLLDAIESGGIQVVEIKPGIYVEVVPNETGNTGIAVNFCPFCGGPRPNAEHVGVATSVVS